MAEEINAVFIETSAKDNKNVNDIFELVVTQMIRPEEKPNTRNCSIMWFFEKYLKENDQETF